MEEVDAATESDDDSGGSVEDLRQELNSAVEKIFQLREIIRSLEAEAEKKREVERRTGKEVAELRNALTDSLLTQQMVQDELEQVKKRSTDKELVELVEGLREQLTNKSQELQKHRAAHQYLHDVKASTYLS